MARRRRSGVLVAAALGATCLTLASLAVVEPDAEAFLAAALVWTARLAAPFFLAAYLASTLAGLSPAARPLLVQRRGLGLAFAAVHGVHGVLILAWVRLTGATLDPVTLVAGGAAYGFAALMAATSNDASVRRLRGHWHRLHRVGLHWLWLVFTVTFATGEGPVPSAFAAAFLGALGLRLAGRVLHRSAAP